MCVCVWPWWGGVWGVVPSEPETIKGGRPKDSSPQRQGRGSVRVAMWGCHRLGVNGGSVAERFPATVREARCFREEQQGLRVLHTRVGGRHPFGWVPLRRASQGRARVARTVLRKGR